MIKATFRHKKARHILPRSRVRLHHWLDGCAAVSKETILPCHFLLLCLYNMGRFTRPCTLYMATKAQGIKGYSLSATRLLKP